MKLIEILIENDEEDWGSLRDYEPKDLVLSNEQDAIALFRGDFLQELKKILEFLIVWERKASQYRHTVQSTKAAIHSITSIIGAIEFNPDNTLAEKQENSVKEIAEKLRTAALNFGSLSHDFKNAEQDSLSRISVKIHDLLSSAANEIISVSSTKFKVA